MRKGNPDLHITEIKVDSARALYLSFFPELKGEREEVSKRKRGYFCLFTLIIAPEKIQHSQKVHSNF